MTEAIATVEALKTEVAPVVQRANELVIITADDYAGAAEFCKTVKGAQKRVTEFFAPMVKANLEATRATNAAKAQVLDPLMQAEGAIKKKQLNWSMGQERIRLAEEARLNAIEACRARKEREKAEAEARRQRQIEEDARRLAEDARRKAEKAKGEERARLEAEANKADRTATAAAAKAQAKEEAAANVQTNTVTVASIKPDVKGQSERTTFKARIIDVAKVPLEYMVPNMDALNAIAKSTKGAITIPGVEMYPETTMASSSK
ncbi:MAG: hypothetical protein WC497_05450 [Patescibacteria group bacterium]